LITFYRFEKLDSGFWTKPKRFPLLQQKEQQNIDLWLLSVSEWEGIEPTVSLILQLGAMINRVDWKYKLRVICIVDSKDKIDEEKKRLNELLFNARVNAQAVVVVVDDSDLQKLGLKSEESTKKMIATSNSMENLYKNLFEAVAERITIVESTSMQFTNNQGDNDSLPQPVDIKNVLPRQKNRAIRLLETKISQKYLITNQIVKRVSTPQKTRLIVLPMPSTLKEDDERFLVHLNDLTNGLQPTLLVHGQKCVISTEL
jgi:hypothetical protein